MNRFLLCILLVACSGLAAAGDATRISDESLDVAKKLRDTALTDSTAYDFVAALTTEIGPRLAGGPNDQRARDWTVARFKALGFDKVWTEPATYPKWVRRGEHASIVAPYPQNLVVLALGHSPGTPKGGVSGDIVAFKDFTEFQKADAASVKEKIVYIGYRMHQTRDGHDYGMGSQGRTQGPALAAKLGAKAFLLRSAGTDNDRVAHTGVTQFEKGDPQVPAAAMSNPDADLIERMLATGKTVTVKLDLDCGMEGSYTGANVIGEITGSEKPDEAVVIGGHLDSWDPGTGAIDDGAGVAIAAGAAHLIGALPHHPKRSVRVVAFANEEAGMFGGHAFAEAHKADVAKFTVGAESDFGSGKVWKLSSKVKPEALGAIDCIMQVLAPLGVERGPDNRGHGGDFGAMGDAGMAIVDLGQDGTRYFDWHHTANDTLDKLDPKDLAQNVAVYAVFAFLAADAIGDFGSAPGAFPSKN